MVTDDEIAAAVAALRSGQLVALPTETVYGLGADASNADAVRRIFAAKGRPADHPVIVHLAEPGDIEAWAVRIPPAAYALAERFWPGPLTLILPRAPHVLGIVTGGQPSVGLRVPSHPVARRVLKAFGGGVAAPSANRFGRISPTRAEHVRAELGAAVAVILDGGPSEVGLESTIVDLSGPEPALLRPGHIALAELAAVLGAPPTIPQAPTTRAPGTLSSHYAPLTPVTIVAGAELAAAIAGATERLAVLARRAAPPAAPSIVWRTLPDEPHAFGHALYATLRELDAVQASRILVEAVPSDGAWAAIADRLRRAAHRDPPPQD